MDKLYYIVCEEKGEALFEGRFQGRTRGAAIKFLKEQIGRPGLNGTVFTITEIPVPLIREIVEGIINGQPALAANQPLQPINGTNLERKAERFDAYAKPEAAKNDARDGQINETDWKAVKRFYSKTRSPKKTAAEFGISVNTVKTRVRREGWK
jgi:hypothetical protein